jgi:hypothetical protein
VRWLLLNAKLKLPPSGLTPAAAEDRYEQRRLAAAGFPSLERWLSPGVIEDHRHDEGSVGPSATNG